MSRVAGRHLHLHLRLHLHLHAHLLVPLGAGEMRMRRRFGKIWWLKLEPRPRLETRLEARRDLLACRLRWEVLESRVSPRSWRICKPKG